MAGLDLLMMIGVLCLAQLIAAALVWGITTLWRRRRGIAPDPILRDGAAVAAWFGAPTSPEPIPLTAAHVGRGVFHVALAFPVPRHGHYVSVGVPDGYGAVAEPIGIGDPIERIGITVWDLATGACADPPNFEAKLWLLAKGAVAGERLQ